MNRLARLAAQIDVNSIQFTPEEHQSLVQKLNGAPTTVSQHSQGFQLQGQTPKTHTGVSDPTLIYNPYTPPAQPQQNPYAYDPYSALDSDMQERFGMKLTSESSRIRLPQKS